LTKSQPLRIIIFVDVETFEINVADVGAVPTTSTNLLLGGLCNPFRGWNRIDGRVKRCGVYPVGTR